jgi:hypothetical protein
MVKFFKLILIVFFLFFLVSCGSKLDGSISKNFKQGLGEVSVSLMENNPPKTIYPNSNFKLILNIESSVAYDVESGSVRVVGFDEDYFEIYPLEESFEKLIAKGPYNPDGSKVLIELDGESKNLFQNSVKYNADYFIEINYKSSLKFSETVCVNTNLYRSIGSGCEVNSKQSYSGQGASFAIINLEEIISPGIDPRVEFRFKLKNIGSGNLISVNLNNANLGKEKLDCRFQDFSSDKKQFIFTSKKQETTLICMRSLNENDAYSTTLLLDFDYSYKSNNKHRLTMVK